MRQEKHQYTYLLCITLCLWLNSVAQDSTSSVNKLISFPDKVFTSIDKKASNIEGKLTSKTEKYLSKIEKQENKLKKKLQRKDSVLANSVFGDIESNYNNIKIKQAAITGYANTYSGHLDSISTALGFVKDLSILKNNNIPNFANVQQLQKLDKSLENLKSLQSKFNQTEQIKQYLQQRQQFLKQQLQKVGMVKELRKFRKEVYYYQAQVREYKQIFEDPNKLEAKLMEVVTKVPAFKDFFAKNSELGSLFALPGGNAPTSASLQGLQTRAMVNQGIQERFGTGADITQVLKQNLQQAQNQLSALKSKVSQYSSGSFGNSGDDLDMPDFKPNEQKTKSFLNRLEYGANVQSQKARSIFPVTSDLGVSLGYKINDKSIVGIGASYKVGWGSGFNNIKITHQGVGVRSYVDWKLKGSLYIAGGYEMNYRTVIGTIDQLKGYSSWQKSGLVGLSKKYNVSKKLKGNMQLLWDFLSYQQVPYTQPILFRIGYSLK